MTLTQTLPSAALFYCEGGSDKEYHACIEAKDDGFIVNFAFGRRGAALTPGCKTSSPITLEAATKIFPSGVMAFGIEPALPGTSTSENWPMW